MSKQPTGKSALSEGLLQPTEELKGLLRERFPEKGKTERIASRVAKVDQDLPPINLTPEQWRMIAEDDDVLEQ